MSTLRHHRIVYSQNFLRSPRLVDRLLDRSAITGDELVIEVGPGRGVITERLAARCRQVLAIERDPVLVEELGARFAHATNVAIFAGDFLSFPLPLTAYKVFANIPFNITAAIVGKLTSGTSPPVDAYLTVQREAADRFLGTPRQTLVALLLQPWFEPTVVHRFRPNDFAPKPGVEVVLLRLQRRPVPLVAPPERTFFEDFTTYVFTAWQPTVRVTLARILPGQTVARIERTAGVSLERPPSAIPFAEWISLTDTFRSVAGERVARRVTAWNDNRPTCKGCIARVRPAREAREERHDEGHPCFLGSGFEPRLADDASRIHCAYAASAARATSSPEMSQCEAA